MSVSPRLDSVLARIDEANRADPNREPVDGELLPREYAYSLHMTRWLWTLEPAPSELMQIACRAQHIERWKLPRHEYPDGGKGYYQWRRACAAMHGRRAAELMAQCGYPEADCRRVQTIVGKQDLHRDEGTRLLEDVACMVFLEKYFAGFYLQKADYERSRWLRILRRTWHKMTPRGHQAALALATELPAHLQALLQEALTAEEE